jgi:hypothetical protein
MLLCGWRSLKAVVSILLVVIRRVSDAAATNGRRDVSDTRTTTRDDAALLHELMKNPRLHQARGPNGQQQLVDELIFKRDVNEVFLLIDYISGRTDKSLKDLDVEKLEVAGAPALVTPGQVLRKFCEIGYPPVPEPRVKAENAAFVLEVKDRLNALARPARGITIAYTTVFVGNAALWLRKNSYHQKTLVDQAGEAFPSIVWHARLFAQMFSLLLPIFLVLWFLLTAFTYWDVGYGGSLVQTVQKLDNERASLLQTLVVQTGTPAVCRASIPEGPGARDLRDACSKIARVEEAVTGARANLKDFYGEVAGPPAGAFGAFRPIRWGFRAYSPQPLDSMPEQSVTWVLTLFGAYVLPAMFGLLGTIASIVRVLQTKARDSLLGPRDLSLSLLGLLIGPLAGLAVGLFYAPSPAVTPGVGGLASSITLTASGLGFLAGYGSDVFFKFLDALLTRVFALEERNRNR